MSTLRRTLSLKAAIISSEAEARMESPSGKVVGSGKGIEKDEEGRLVLTGEIEVCREEGIISSKT